MGLEETRGIEWALDRMRRGFGVCRAGWNGKGMALYLQVPDGNSKMTRTYVYIKTADGHMVPWVCSQSDLLATDWEHATDD